MDDVRLPSTLGVAALAALLACSASTASSGAPASSDPSGTTDGGTEDALAEEPPCPPPNVSFTRSPVTITPTRDHHHTFVREVAGVPYLYVLGGESEDFDLAPEDVEIGHPGDFADERVVMVARRRDRDG